jgi:hypothetical protein
VTPRRPWRPNALRDLLIRIEKPMSRRPRRKWKPTPAERVRWLRGIVMAAGLVGMGVAFAGPSLPPWCSIVADGVVGVTGYILGKPIVESWRDALKMPEQTPPPSNMSEATKVIGEGNDAL